MTRDEALTKVMHALPHRLSVAEWGANEIEDLLTALTALGLIAFDESKPQARAPGA